MSKYRDPYWDNLKTILIFLVVLGHFLYPVRNNSRYAEILYEWIHLFHMPAFIFVSGYFSKSFFKKDRKEYKLTGFLTLYILFVICLWMIDLLFHQKIHVTEILSTPGAAWYMLSMFAWHLLIVYFGHLSPLLTAAATVTVGLAAGLFTECGQFLSMSRTIVFFPFFAAGYFFNGKYIDDIRLWMKGIALSIFVLLGVLLIMYPSQMKALTMLTYARESYFTLGLSSIKGILYRFLWYILSAVLIICVMCITPKKRFVTTYIGGRTLGIYIVHILVRNVFMNLNIFDYFGTGVQPVLICILLTILILWLSSAEHITNTLNRLFHIDIFMNSSHQQSLEQKSAI